MDGVLSSCLQYGGLTIVDLISDDMAGLSNLKQPTAFTRDPEEFIKHVERKMTGMTLETIKEAVSTLDLGKKSSRINTITSQSNSFTDIRNQL